MFFFWIALIWIVTWFLLQTFLGLYRSGVDLWFHWPALASWERWSESWGVIGKLLVLFWWGFHLTSLMVTAGALFGDQDDSLS